MYYRQHGATATGEGQGGDDQENPTWTPATEDVAPSA